MATSLFIEYNPALPYGEGARVTSGMYLYKAIRDVPAGVPISDTSYWVTQGDGGGTGTDVVTMTESEVEILTNNIIKK
jgi:hypothetical protein